MKRIVTLARAIWGCSGVKHHIGVSPEEEKTQPDDASCTIGKQQDSNTLKDFQKAREF